MKLPEQCENIQDIRVEIDNIDKKIINLLGTRYNYVKAASKFKKNEENVRADDRVKKMIEKRREWAESEGLSPDIVENIYRTLVNYFISEELNEWRK